MASFFTGSKAVETRQHDLSKSLEWAVAAGVCSWVTGLAVYWTAITTSRFVNHRRVLCEADRARDAYESRVGSEFVPTLSDERVALGPAAPPRVTHGAGTDLPAPEPVGSLGGNAAAQGNIGQVPTLGTHRPSGPVKVEFAGAVAKVGVFAAMGAGLVYAAESFLASVAGFAAVLTPRSVLENLGSEDYSL